MSYQVLARRWRPMRFEEVVGQDAITQTLANSITSERIAHAFIFSGPRGVGKTTAARILAKALNCAEGPTATPCCQCVHCIEIAEGRSLDVQELDAATHTGVDDVRQLTETMAFAPARDRFRIYIIDEVHMLSRSAFNALLKTIEEPPPHGKFILATTEIQKVPATILSRCQRYEFRRIATPEIIEALRRIRDSDGLAIQDDALELVARMAEGSMRDAQSLLDQVISYSGGEARADTVRRLLGKLDPVLLIRLLEALAEGEAGAALEIFSGYIDQGGDPRRFLQELQGALRDLCVLRTTGQEAAALTVPADRIEAASELARRLPLASWSAMFRVLDESERDLKEASDPRLLLDMLLLELARLRELVPVSELLARLESAPAGPPPPATNRPSPPPADRPSPMARQPKTASRTRPTTAHTKPPAPPPASTPSPAPAPERKEPPPPEPLEFDPDVPEQAEAFWRAVVEDLGRREMRIVAGLADKAAFPSTIGPEGLMIRIDATDAGLLEEPDRWRTLGESVQRVLGRNLALRKEVSREPVSSLARRREEAAAARRRELEEQARAHPAVQRTIELFDASLDRIEGHPVDRGE